MTDTKEHTDTKEELTEAETRFMAAVSKVLEQATETLGEVFSREDALDVLEDYYLGRTVFILTKDGLTVAAKDEIMPEPSVGYYP